MHDPSVFRLLSHVSAPSTRSSSNTTAPTGISLQTIPRQSRAARVPQLQAVPSPLRKRAAIWGEIERPAVHALS